MAVPVPARLTFTKLVVHDLDPGWPRTARRCTAWKKWLASRPRVAGSPVDEIILGADGSRSGLILFRYLDPEVPSHHGVILGFDTPDIGAVRLRRPPVKRARGAPSIRGSPASPDRLPGRSRGPPRRGRAAVAPGPVEQGVGPDRRHGGRRRYHAPPIEERTVGRRGAAHRGATGAGAGASRRPSSASPQRACATRICTSCTATGAGCRARGLWATRGSASWRGLGPGAEGYAWSAIGSILGLGGAGGGFWCGALATAPAASRGCAARVKADHRHVRGVVDGVRRVPGEDARTQCSATSEVLAGVQAGSPRYGAVKKLLVHQVPARLVRLRLWVPPAGSATTPCSSRHRIRLQGRGRRHGNAERLDFVSHRSAPPRPRVPTRRSMS